MLYPGGISLLLLSLPFTPLKGEVSSPPGLRLPALTIPAIKGDPAVPGRRSTYSSELLLVEPPPRSHDMTSRAVDAEEALLLVDRKSNQWLFEPCPPLSAVAGCGLGTKGKMNGLDFNKFGREDLDKFELT